MGFIAVEWLLNGIYSNYKLLQNFIDSHPLRALGAPVRVPWDFSTSEHPTVVEVWLNGNLSHNQQRIYIYIWLMVSTLWKIWKSDWIIIPSIWKNKEYSKPPTRIYMALLNGILRDYSQNIYFLVLNKCTFTLFIWENHRWAMFIHFLLKCIAHLPQRQPWWNTS